MRSLRPLPWLLLFAALAAAGEDEDYRIVAAARDHALAVSTQDARRVFERSARVFLTSYRNDDRTHRVALWLGDFLEDEAPRQALQAYERAGGEEGRQREAAILFRHEAPPPLAVEAWVGGPPVSPPRARDRVYALVFFSLTHPQTKHVLARLAALQKRYERRDFSIVGVSSVVDDRANQLPEMLEKRLKELALPFPVAVDRQTPQGRSVSLDRYRGRYLPWAVFLDRYGRIAYVDGFSCHGNPAARAEGELEKLLLQPTYAELSKDLAAGGERARRALGRLKHVRTVHTAEVLFDAAKSIEDAGVRKELEAVLAGLLPEGYGTGGFDAAHARFEREKGELHYSFEKDRLVPRK